MYATELLLSLLKLDPSWSISEIEIDEPSNRLDITLCYGGQKKRFFWQKSRTVPLDQYITVRHLPIWGMRTFLHVPPPDKVDANMNWMSAYSGFTHKMDKFIADALDTCRSNQGAAELTGLTTAEIRENSERLGIVTSKTDIAFPEEVAVEPVEHLTERSFDLPYEDSALIPPQTHPGWQQLIDGKVELISRAIGLQMLLQRVRQAIANNPTETERLANINLVRQYFIKNHGLHEQDIKLLFGSVSPAREPEFPVADTGIANENDPQWRSIIDASASFETDNVGLQMMLEQIRRSVVANPSESNYLVGAKILRQFFLKHQKQLGTEMAQIGFADTDTTPAQDSTVSETVMRVPAETHQIWRRIINGELTVRTNIMSLQMMLGQLRQSVTRNPSEQSWMAGVRILRRFFLKHQSRLSDELQQLSAAAGNAANVPDSAVTSLSARIPRESSLVWEKLINGNLQIHTDAVALKMMLERVRISIYNNPSDATKRAGVKILRQYFIKHQQAHRAELNQLMAA